MLVFSTAPLHVYSDNTFRNLLSPPTGCWQVCEDESLCWKRRKHFSNTLQIRLKLLLAKLQTTLFQYMVSFTVLPLTYTWSWPEGSKCDESWVFQSLDQTSETSAEVRIWITNAEMILNLYYPSTLEDVSADHAASKSHYTVSFENRCRVVAGYPVMHQH